MDVLDETARRIALNKTDRNALKATNCVTVSDAIKYV